MRSSKLQTCRDWESGAKLSATLGAALDLLHGLLAREKLDERHSQSRFVVVSVWLPQVECGAGTSSRLSVFRAGSLDIMVRRIPQCD